MSIRQEADTPLGLPDAGAVETTEETREEEKTQALRPISILWKSFVLPPLLGVVFYAGQVAQDHGIDLTSRNFPWSNNYSSPREIEAPKSTTEQMNLIDRFSMLKRSFQIILSDNFSFGVARLSDEKRAVEFLNTQAKVFAIDSVYIARMVLPANEANRVYEARDRVFVDEREFGLDSVYERSVAVALMDFKMQKVRQNFASDFSVEEFKKQEEVLRRYNANGESWATPQYEYIESKRSTAINELEDKINLLYWLYDKRLDIRVDKDAWAILEPDHLLVLAKTLKTAGGEQFTFPLAL